MKLVNLIQGRNVRFVEYHSGNLFYQIVGGTFRFAVPVDELDGSRVGVEEKASVFLKWIKRTLKEIDERDTTKVWVDEAQYMKPFTKEDYEKMKGDIGEVTPFLAHADEHYEMNYRGGS